MDCQFNPLMQFMIIVGVNVWLRHSGVGNKFLVVADVVLEVGEWLIVTRGNCGFKCLTNWSDISSLIGTYCGEI